MDSQTFRRYGHELVDWVADYMDQVEELPVLSRVKPGEVRARIPTAPPVQAEEMDQIIQEFKDIILPGITHWNHPRFFAYFPANNSGPSILAELLSAALGVNGMVWQSSPAATELEEAVMDWLRQMLRLPTSFRGVIQDTASTATIAALLCAREKMSAFGVNEKGFSAGTRLGKMRVYTSTEGHSSIEKGGKIVGFGRENVVRVPVDDAYAMDPEALRRMVEQDKAEGYAPCCVVATIGTTSSTAIDPLTEIARVAQEYNLWLHVDAALAGSAAILPEKRWILDGIEGADSFVFNPHKWLFTNFDCSAFFCRHPDMLVSVFAIAPEYLKTARDSLVTNYRDWGIQLGRRFRALKLWFVIRYFGVRGLQARLRRHLALAQEFAAWVDEHPHFETLAPVPLNTVCFRFNGGSGEGQHPAEDELATLNERLMAEVNDGGRIFLTHTKLQGKFCLRLSIGQTQTERRHVLEAWQTIRQSQVVSSVAQG
jgi:aromatic-L-amino-acid decarboxylase